MAFDSVKFHRTNKFSAIKYSIVGNYSTKYSIVGNYSTKKKRRYGMTEHNLLKLMKSGNLLNLMKSGKNNSKWDLKLSNIC